MSIHHVSEASTVGLITIHHALGMDLAYKLMKQNQIRHLPVVSEAGEIIGILSDRDVQRAMRSQIQERGEVATEETVDFDPAAIVHDYMSWPVHTADRTAPLSYAVEKLLREKISALLVMDGSRVFGILTTEDMLRVLLSLLGEPEAGDIMDVESVVRRSAAEVYSPFR